VESLLPDTRIPRSTCRHVTTSRCAYNCRALIRSQPNKRRNEAHLNRGLEGRQGGDTESVVPNATLQQEAAIGKQIEAIGQVDKGVAGNGLKLALRTTVSDNKELRHQEASSETGKQGVPASVCLLCGPAPL
jgi:hypothetical protein